MRHGQSPDLFFSRVFQGRSSGHRNRRWDEPPLFRFSKKLRFFLVLGALCLLATPSAFAKVFDAQSFKLANGLNVIVIPNDRAPVVTSMLWYKIGAADEPWGKSGNAHFFEHLMFKGTKSTAPGEFSKIVRTLGGDDNAFTSQDYTAFFESVSVDALEKVLAMEADRMRNLDPPAKEFESEHKVILEERRQRTDNDPQARFAEQMDAALYVNHPYGRPVIGWKDEMERLDWPTAKAFYQRYYRPDNAILVVSGDVTEQKLRPLVEKTFGKIPAQKIALPPRTRPHSPPLRGETLVRVADPDIRQPLTQSMWRVPSAHQNPEESLALQILAEILGGGPSTRLYQDIVVGKKLATGIDMGYQSTRLDDGEVSIFATVAPGVQPENVATAIAENLRTLVQKGVTDQELRTAKDALEAAAIYARDSLAGPAMTVGQALATGQSLEDVESWPERIETVTAAQVQEVAAKYLDPDNPDAPMHVTGYLTGRESVAPETTPPAPLAPASSAPALAPSEKSGATPENAEEKP